MAALNYGRLLDACAGVGASREGAAQQEMSKPSPLPLLTLALMSAVGIGNAAAAARCSGSAGKVLTRTVRQCAT